MSVWVLAWAKKRQQLQMQDPDDDANDFWYSSRQIVRGQLAVGLGGWHHGEQLKSLGGGPRRPVKEWVLDTLLEALGRFLYVRIVERLAPVTCVIDGLFSVLVRPWLSDAAGVFTCGATCNAVAAIWALTYIQTQTALNPTGRPAEPSRRPRRQASLHREPAVHRRRGEEAPRPS